MIIYKGHLVTMVWNSFVYHKCEKSRIKQGPYDEVANVNEYTLPQCEKKLR